MDYRFYLLDAMGKFQASAPFIATDDEEAKCVAAFVGEAASDVFDGYELWRGSAQVAGRRQRLSSDRALRRATTPSERQTSIFDLTDRLQRSFVRVRRSRTLLEIATRLPEVRALDTRHGLIPAGGPDKHPHGAARRPVQSSRGHACAFQAVSRTLFGRPFSRWVRLCGRYRKLMANGKRRTVVVAAIAREMSAFLWAIGQQVKPLLAS